MTPTGIITAIVIGAIIGLLGRLVLPGKQPIGLLVTILVGIVSALIGTWQSVVLVDLNVDNPRRSVRISFVAG